MLRDGKWCRFWAISRMQRRVFWDKISNCQINMPRNVHLITFVRSSPISIILLQLIIYLSPSKYLFACYMETKYPMKKRDRQWRRRTYEE